MERPEKREGRRAGAHRDDHAECDRDERPPDRRRAWTEVLAWGIAARLVVLAAAALVPLLHWPDEIVHGTGHGAFGLLGTWDGRWYGIVADRGYLLVPGRQSDPAFFPLLPVFLLALHALGLSLFAAGLALSNLALLVGLVAFYELGRAVVPEADARRAACYAAVFPAGFVFSMVYPEALAFAALALAGLLAYRRRWLAAAACAAAASLARPEGAVVALPLLVLALRLWPRMRTLERGRALGAVLAAPAALAAYPLYLWWSLGDPSAWQKAERGWGRSFQAAGWLRAVHYLSLHPQNGVYPLVGAIFVGVYLVALVLAWRLGVPLSWIAFGVALVLLPPFSGTFAADGRFGLLALPAYWGLARLGRSRLADVSIRAAFVPLLAAGVASVPYWFP